MILKFSVIQTVFGKYIYVYIFSPLDPNQYSWGENYAGSSGLMSVSPDMNPMQRARSGTVSPQWVRDLGYLKTWGWAT